MKAFFRDQSADCNTKRNDDENEQQLSNFVYCRSAKTKHATITAGAAATMLRPSKWRGKYSAFASAQAHALSELIQMLSGSKNWTRNKQSARHKHNIEITQRVHFNSIRRPPCTMTCVSFISHQMFTSSLHWEFVSMLRLANRFVYIDLLCNRRWHQHNEFIFFAAAKLQYFYWITISRAK